MARRRAAGVTFEQVRQIALSLPDVTEGRYYGLPAFFVGGRFFAGYREKLDALPVKITFEDRDFLIRAKPEVYYITDHYLNYPAVLVRLAAASSADVGQILESAREVAVSLGPKKATKPRRRPPARKRAS